MSKKKPSKIIARPLPSKPSKKKGGVLQAIAGTADSPLIIDGVEIPCYVLEDETRVLSQRGLLSSINVSRGGARNTWEAENLGVETFRFVTQKWIQPFISEELALALKSPIPFGHSGGRSVAYGYPAVVLPDICSAVIKAYEEGATMERQSGIVKRAMLLLRGLAHVGIVALVDEATGYQRIRAEKALAVILEKFIAKELQMWTKTFPFEFYEQICRLKQWPDIYSESRPAVIGHYTNALVYERLAPGVLDELRKNNPVLPNGYRRNKHHQWLSPDQGHPKLQEHLIGVVAIMRVSSSWDECKRNITKAFPKPGEQLFLDL